MSASTTDRATKLMAGTRRVVLLAANAIIFAGCFVCRNSSGYLVDASDATGLTFAGLAEEGYDATGESNGDTSINVLHEGVVLMKASGLAAGDVGKPVFLLDNQTVATSDHASLVYHVYVGILREYVSATEGWVEIRPGEKNPRLITATVEVTGTNAAALSFATVAAYFGGTGLYIKRVLAAAAYVTATAAPATATRKVLTTDYTLASGVVTTVGNETANTWQISVLAVVQE